MVVIKPVATTELKAVLYEQLHRHRLHGGTGGAGHREHAAAAGGAGVQSLAAPKRTQQQQQPSPGRTHAW